MKKNRDLTADRRTADRGILSVRKRFSRKRLVFLCPEKRFFVKKKFLTAFVVCISFLISAVSLPDLHPGPLAAETVPPFEMAVSLNEYAINASDSNYYAWRGKVNLTGDIAAVRITHTSIVAYFDSEVVPFFEIPVEQMVKNDEKYTFAIQVDTTKYKSGYHTLRVFNGPEIMPSGENMLWSVPVFFGYPETATITNVSINCNMRQKATADSTISPILTTVPLGTPVNVLDKVTGQYVSGTGPDYSYGTNVWYNVCYEKGATVYTGYILSAFLKVMATGIAKMKVTASDTVIEEFLPGKYGYQANLPFSAYDFSISELVMYNKDDTLKVILNGNEAVAPYTSLPLKTGDNKVELITASGTEINAPTATYTYDIWRIAESTEAEFKAQLEKFPESYKAPLRALHSKYPAWLFTAFNTNLDWNVVVFNEDSGSTSLIWKNNLPAEYKKSDIIMDGTSFVTASKAAVEYYLDPRNFLDDKAIFQFEQLTFQKSMHTLAGVGKLISGTGLAGREAMFLKAGVESNVSPYHLAARSRQEVTLWDPIGLSTIARGTYTGANNKYYGLYNFYNIGTGSSTDSDLLTQRGLNFAIGNYADGTPKPEALKIKYHFPWDTEEKAIIGGGIYIGENYINKGQDTLYLQKFDVDPIDGLYTHQYMQNIQAPYNEAQGSYKAYSLTNALNNSFVFRIPYYKNMPLLRSPKPEDTNKLDTLAVTGYPMTPEFDPEKDTIYKLNVPATANKITITATTLNSKAAVTGTGVKALEYGTANTFIITCTPSSGEKRNYTIQVTRNFPETSSNNLLSSLTIASGLSVIAYMPKFSPDLTGPYHVTVPETTQDIVISATPQVDAATVAGTGLYTLIYGTNIIPVAVKAQNEAVRNYEIQITRSLPKITSKTFTMSNGIVNGIPVSTTVSGFRIGLDETISTIKLFDISGKECADTAVLGTGMKVLAYYEGTLQEELVVLIYGDVNGDGKVNSTDITAFKRHILKLKLITGNYLAACDVNRDGKYNSTDYTIIKRHILNLQKISQK